MHIIKVILLVARAINKCIVFVGSTAKQDIYHVLTTRGGTGTITTSSVHPSSLVILTSLVVLVICSGSTIARKDIDSNRTLILIKCP